MAGGLAGDSEQADRCLQQAWDSGAVAERFGRMVRGLGGPADLLEHPHQHLPAAPVVVEVHAKRSGQVGRIDTRALGFAVVALGGGRRRAGDRIDRAWVFRTWSLWATALSWASRWRASMQPITTAPRPRQAPCRRRWI